jgi:hypothetical protein
MGSQIKAICRDLGVSRKVVRKVIRSGSTEFRYHREDQPLPRISRWRDALDQLLLANDAKASRERLTLIRIFEELRDRGYDGRRPERPLPGLSRLQLHRSQETMVAHLAHDEIREPPRAGKLSAVSVRVFTFWVRSGELHRQVAVRHITTHQHVTRALGPVRELLLQREQFWADRIVPFTVEVMAGEVAG